MAPPFSSLQTMVIIGECNGTYVNEAVTKEFSGKLLMTARPDGTVIVHDLGAGVRPICYINGGAEISLARNVKGAEIEMFATTEDKQQLTLAFIEVMAMTLPDTMKCPNCDTPMKRLHKDNIRETTGYISTCQWWECPECGKQEYKKEGDSLSNSPAMSILKCVFDVAGKYGRTTIAKILTGSVAKKVLTSPIRKLSQYRAAKDTPITVILTLIDWLIEENYIAYVEDSEFPVLVITSKGLDILAGGDELPVEEGYDPGQLDPLQESEADEIAPEDLEAAAATYDKVAAGTHEETEEKAREEMASQSESKEYQLTVCATMLKKQIDDLLTSNIPEDSKTGLHNLLGTILDQAEET